MSDYGKILDERIAAAALATPVPGAVSNAMVFVCSCGCKEFARVDELKADGSFRPGPLVRCVNCKVVSTFPLEAAVQSPPIVGVRALEWNGHDTLVKAETLSGVYRVWTPFEANGQWHWDYDGYVFVSGKAASKPEAKAAAQADYEARIRSALSSLAPVEAVATEPVACPDCNGTGVENKPWMNGENCVPCKGTGYTIPTGDSGALREALAVSEEMAERYSAGVNAYWKGRRSGRDGDAIMAGLKAALSKGEPGK